MMLELYCLVCVIITTAIALARSGTTRAMIYNSSLHMLGGAVGYLIGKGFHYDDNFIILFGLVGCFYADWLFDSIIPSMVRSKIHDFKNRRTDSSGGSRSDSDSE